MFIYKRKNICYIGFSLKEKDVLKLNNHSLNTVNKSLAQIKLNEIKRRYDALKNNYKYSRLGIIDKTFSMVFEEYKNFMMFQGRTLCKGTIERFDNAFKYLYKSTGDKKINKYTTEDYEKIFLSMSEISLSTKAVYLRSIYTVFNFAFKKNYIQKNNFQKIRPPKLLPNIPTNEQIKTLLQYAKKTKFDLIIRLMLVTGLRLQEALHFKKSVNVKGKYIMLIGKGNKPALMPILSEAQEVLNEMEDGFNFSEHALYRFFLRFYKMTGINISSHQLRKYCLTTLANANANIYFVKEYARHADIKTTLEVYVQADIDKIKDEFDKIRIIG